MARMDLRATREKLGATHQRIAELADVRPEEIAEWERVGKVPRKHRLAVDTALWELERDAALQRSGLPECEWMSSDAAMPDGFVPHEVIRHVESCPTCTARGEYVARHVRPMPGPAGGGLVMSVIGVADRLPGWQRSAFLGAMALLGMGGIGVPVLLVKGLLARDPALVAGALALFVLLVVSGAAGGIVHYVTAPLRKESTLGYYGSWTLTVYGYMLAAFALVSLAGSILGPEFGDEADLAFFREPVGWIIFLVMGAFFGVVAGRGARRADREQVEPRRSGGVLSLPNVAVAVAVLLGFGATVLSRSPEARSMTPAEAEGALPGLQATARANPRDPEAQRDLALALGALERWDEARRALETAVRLDPGDAELANSLGWVLVREGKHQEALLHIERAIRLDPWFSYAHSNQGWALYKLGRLDEAGAAFREAIRLDPRNPDAHGGLGWVLVDSYQPEPAAAEFREAIRLDPGSAWHHQGLATAEMRGARFNEAMASYREAARLAPDDAPIWADIGRLEHLMGDYEDSAAAFEKADRLDPGYFGRDPYLRGMWEASKAGRPYEPPEQ